MKSEKYTVRVIINNQILFEKHYTTYQNILADFPCFLTTENVRTCRKMTAAKQHAGTYFKSTKCQFINISPKSQTNNTDKSTSSPDLLYSVLG